MSFETAQAIGYALGAELMLCVYTAGGLILWRIFHPKGLLASTSGLTPNDEASTFKFSEPKRTPATRHERRTPMNRKAR